jgi:transposase InsO family protein
MNVGVWVLGAMRLSMEESYVCSISKRIVTVAIAIDIGLSYPARAVVETLENLKGEIGTLNCVRCDNGPKFISRTFMEWCTKNHIEIKYTQPGKPM